MLDLGGFSISLSTQNTIVWVVVIYSVVIVALGLFVKYQRKKNSQNRLSSFLTGGGGLGSFEVAMVSMTFGLAGGTMISGPGLTYGSGFISAVAVYAGMIGAFATFGNIGKKVAIVGKRLHASTVIQMLHHRFQSKKLVFLLAFGMVLFVIPKLSSQLMVAAKLFATLTGSNSYLIGILIATVATVIYTLSGGLKAIAKVCVFQGVLMIFVVVLLVFRQYDTAIEMFGSVENAYRYVAEIKPSMLQADVWTPMYTLGMCLLYGWASFAQPGAIHTALTYRSPRAFSRAIVISVLCGSFIQFGLTGSSVLTYALNPNLTQPDLAVVYLSTTMLPDVLAGFAIIACFAAVQSTVSGLLLVTAASICKDVYKECIRPDASEKTVSRINGAAVVLLSVLAILISLHPTKFTQLLNTFSGAGLDIVFIAPLMFGVYWKNATEKGAQWSVIGGLSAYIVGYVLQRYVPEFWSSVMGNIHPIIPGLVLSAVLMILVSRKTKKVPLGICEVWFSDEYEEEFCSMYDLK